MRERPAVGSVTELIKKIPVCKMCGCIADGMLCNYYCPEDAEIRTPANTILAVYRITETFLGDEPYKGENL